ncbi:hypothetical protein Y032_0043g805 [Ancylostoma ceylanicum]|uniref:Uncharacterized protein n=1 Tax=Ancylostoma ceylanicum TaxID=53326 RepID=A0A016UFG7_9BILA|nr:hypothetical protein Y032_0043g805 [Ancylostoma ceylanicum]
MLFDFPTLTFPRQAVFESRFHSLTCAALHSRHGGPRGTRAVPRERARLVEHAFLRVAPCVPTGCRKSVNGV